MLQRVVVMPGAIADAVALPVERRQRHQHDIGNHLGRGRRRLGNAERPEHQPVVGRPGAKDQRLAARQHHRQRQFRAQPGELAASAAPGRSRCGSANSRRRRARRDLERQPAFGHRLRRSGALLVAQGVALGERGVRRSAFERVVVMEPSLRCHHPRKRVIQYSRDARDSTESRGALDTPHARGMTMCAENDETQRQKIVLGRERR